jgi:hypothetical protein
MNLRTKTPGLMIGLVVHCSMPVPILVASQRKVDQVDRRRNVNYHVVSTAKIRYYSRKN